MRHPWCGCGVFASAIRPGRDSCTSVMNMVQATTTFFFVFRRSDSLSDLNASETEITAFLRLCHLDQTCPCVSPIWKCWTQRGLLHQLPRTVATVAWAAAAAACFASWRSDVLPPRSLLPRRVLASLPFALATPRALCASASFLGPWAQSWGCGKVPAHPAPLPQMRLPHQPRQPVMAARPKPATLCHAQVFEAVRHPYMGGSSGPSPSRVLSI